MRRHEEEPPDGEIDRGEEGRRRLRAGTDMRWETAGIDPQTGGYIYRTRMPAGWLVSFPPTAGAPGPAVHVPDAEHSWVLSRSTYGEEPTED